MAQEKEKKLTISTTIYFMHGMKLVLGIAIDQ